MGACGFEGSRAARHIVAQPASTVDPSAWLRDGAIVIVNTARGTVGDQAAALLAGVSMGARHGRGEFKVPGSRFKVGWPGLEQDAKPRRGQEVFAAARFLCNPYLSVTPPGLRFAPDPATPALDLVPC